MTNYSTQEELESALYGWKEILGLRDWNIDIALLSVDELEVNGRVEVWEDRRKARIWLLEGRNDHDLLIAHELLHIHFNPLEPKQYDDRLEIAKEQAIHAISEGLVLLSNE